MRTRSCKSVETSSSRVNSSTKSQKSTRSGARSRTVKEKSPERSSHTLDDENIEEHVSVPNTIKPLIGRENEFESLVNWINESIQSEMSLSVYISGSPGTGKTATLRNVLESFGSRIRSCVVNCASTSSTTSLIRALFDGSNSTLRPTLTNLQQLVEMKKTPLVVVLDEIDHLCTRTNSLLYAAFRWPQSISHKIVVIGIANSIDLTERILPKLDLLEPPKRLVFEPYSKENILNILKQKMNNAEVPMDEKAVELCARKVSAMSGDLRTALHVFNQTKMNNESGCREVLGVLNSVYSSPLARAKLPLQPRLLLAVCLAITSNKKGSLDRRYLSSAYEKACEAVRTPILDDDDFLAAFRTLESQSFVRQVNNGKIVLQVDSTTARTVINDNAMIDQITRLNL